MRRSCARWTSLLALAACVGCGASPEPTVQSSDSHLAFPARMDVDAKNLPNLIRLHERVYAGGQPEGEAAFAELQSIGVKTIISVDGAKPDVKLAKQYGLRYVHMPHGYDGIPEPRAKALAKAVRDLPGPVYIHCHHGKHRSPAAATVACVSLGLIQPGQALDVLKTAGTSQNYRGLYQSAESARRMEDALLNELQVDFPEVAELPVMAEAMVALEHAHDHLQAIATAGWKPTVEHPDIDPAHEALLLREHFTELARTGDVQQRPDVFRRHLKASATAAVELEASLRSAPPDVKSATRSFAMVTAICAACHQAFRDVPLSEK